MKIALKTSPFPGQSRATVRTATPAQSAAALAARTHGAAGLGRPGAPERDS